MTTVNPNLIRLNNQIQELVERAEKLNSLQEIVDTIKEEMPKLSNYVRRYSYVGPRVTRTKLWYGYPTRDGKVFAADRNRRSLTQIRDIVSRVSDRHEVVLNDRGDIVIYEM